MKTEKNFLDLLLIFTKWKKFLILNSIIAGILTYLAIFFFVQEQYDSYGLIIPSQQQGVSGLSSMLGGLEGLPFVLGNSNADVNLFTNVIYSRTMLDEIIDKFNLLEIYGLDKFDPESKENAREILYDNITAEENEYYGYVIKVRTPDPKLSANITNYIIHRLNDKLVELNIKKSKDNREFLENRLIEIKQRLKGSEDSLKLFQKHTRVFNAEEQVKGTLELLTQLETNLMVKEAELDVYKKLLPKNSPQIKSTEISVAEYKKKLEAIKKGKSHDKFEALIPVDKIPDYALKYYRLLRNVEINSKILEFILPLYEQAKLEEQKNIPVLRVLDYGEPPAKKSFPPRAILTIIITLGVFMLLFVYVTFKESEELQKSEKFQYIKENFFRWNSK